MNNAKLTPAVIIIALLAGTLTGPFEALRDITRDQMTSSNYWLEVLAASVRAFSAAALTGLGLIAGLVGLPLLRAANAAPATIIPTTVTGTGGPSITVTSGPQKPSPAASSVPAEPQ